MPGGCRCVFIPSHPLLLVLLDETPTHALSFPLPVPQGRRGCRPRHCAQVLRLGDADFRHLEGSQQGRRDEGRESGGFDGDGQQACACVGRCWSERIWRARGEGTRGLRAFPDAHFSFEGKDRLLCLWQTSLNSQIDLSQIHCLNEAAGHTIKDLLRGGGDKWLESDADEQLLLHIPFQQSIKLRAIRFTTLSSHSANAPKTIKLFVNQSGVDFDNAESTEAAQEVVLDEAQAKGEKSVELRFVRFQNVGHLSIFVVDNQGGEDVTRVDKLELIGVSVEGTNMADLKKMEEE